MIDVVAGRVECLLSPRWRGEVAQLGPLAAVAGKTEMIADRLSSVFDRDIADRFKIFPRRRLGTGWRKFESVHADMVEIIVTNKFVDPQRIVRALKRDLSGVNVEVIEDRPVLLTDGVADRGCFQRGVMQVCHRANPCGWRKAGTFQIQTN